MDTYPADPSGNIFLKFRVGLFLPITLCFRSPLPGACVHLNLGSIALDLFAFFPHLVILFFLSLLL